jgi:alkylated DNA repair protein (DNA oxidative demethylase)
MGAARPEHSARAGLNAMADLFGLPTLPGLTTAEGIVDADEERALIGRIDEAGLTPFRFQGWEGRRLTVSFGFTYDFTRGRLERGEPIPEWLHPLRSRAAVFGRLAEDELVHALVTRYDPGASIGWHRDRPAFEQVIGISLGASTTMRFRRRRGDRFERTGVPLPSRGIYSMIGEVRHEWEHSIAAMDETRWSVTFRTLSENGEGRSPRSMQ